MIYLDNAATSWPKPPGVAEAMVHFLNEVGANPGRSGHRLSLEAGRIVNAAREAVAELFNAPDPLRVVFCANVTEALNLVLQGYLQAGDHVITSSMEHNSVMRPLRALAPESPIHTRGSGTECHRGLAPDVPAYAGIGGRRGAIELTVLPCTPQGFLDPESIEAAMRPETTMIVLNHASNVCGSMLPVREAGAIARRHRVAGGGACLLLVDAAQTAGAFPVDVDADQIDLLAFTGHKALGGPMGTGGLVVGHRVDVDRLEPLKRGGTGSHSEREEQPDFLPDRYESGTANTVGLAGLLAGLRWVMGEGVEVIRRQEMLLTQRLIDELQAIPGVVVYGGLDAARQSATVSFNIDGLEPSEVGLRLDDEYGILCRVGLHCAPAAHRTLGTFPRGTVRFGLGVSNTLDQVDAALRAVREIADERH